MLGHEGVVGQVRPGRGHPVDLRGLARGEVLVRVQAESRGQQPLPAQDLVDARDAAGEVVPGVEERGVGVRKALAEGEQAEGALASAPP